MLKSFAPTLSVSTDLVWKRHRVPAGSVPTDASRKKMGQRRRKKKHNDLEQIFEEDKYYDRKDGKSALGTPKGLEDVIMAKDEQKTN